MFFKINSHKVQYSTVEVNCLIERVTGTGSTGYGAGYCAGKYSAGTIRVRSSCDFLPSATAIRIRLTVCQCDIETIPGNCPLGIRKETKITSKIPPSLSNTIKNGKKKTMSLQRIFCATTSGDARGRLPHFRAHELSASRVTRVSQRPPHRTVGRLHTFD